MSIMLVGHTVCSPYFPVIRGNGTPEVQYVVPSGWYNSVIYTLNVVPTVSSDTR